MERAVNSTLSARFRRITAGALLVVALSPSLVLAILPIGFGLGLVAGIGSSGLALPVALSTAVVGSVVAFFSLHNTSSTAPSSNDQVISAMINPKSEVPKRPDGYTAPQLRPPGATVDNFIQPTPPSQYTPSTTTSEGGHRWSGIWYTNCEHDGLIAQGNACYQISTGYYMTPIIAEQRCPGPVYYSGSTPRQCAASCKVGYTLSGDTCVLTNALSVQKPADGHCTIIRNGNAFSADPLDQADCVSPTTDGTLSISGDSKSMTATRSDGSRIEVRLQDDGSSVIIDTRPVDGEKTKTTVVTASPPNASTGQSQVTGTSSETYTGTGSGTSTTPDLNVSFDKSGLATEGTQQAVKDAIDGGGVVPGAVNAEGVGSELNGLNDSGAGGAQGRYQDLKAEFKDGWTFSSIIPTVSSCSDPTASVHGVTQGLSICEGVSTIRQIIGFLLYVATAWGVFQIFTRPS